VRKNSIAIIVPTSRASFKPAIALIIISFVSLISLLVDDMLSIVALMFEDNPFVEEEREESEERVPARCDANCANESAELFNCSSELPGNGTGKLPRAVESDLIADEKLSEPSPRLWKDAEALSEKEDKEETLADAESREADALSTADEAWSMDRTMLAPALSTIGETMRYNAIAAIIPIPPNTMPATPISFLTSFSSSVDSIGSHYIVKLLALGAHQRLAEPA